MSTSVIVTEFSFGLRKIFLEAKKYSWVYIDVFCNPDPCVSKVIPIGKLSLFSVDVDNFAEPHKSLCVVFSLLVLAWLIVDHIFSHFHTHAHNNNMNVALGIWIIEYEIHVTIHGSKCRWAYAVNLMLDLNLSALIIDGAHLSNHKCSVGKVKLMLVLIRPVGLQHLQNALYTYSFYGLRHTWTSHQPILKAHKIK